MKRLATLSLVVSCVLSTASGRWFSLFQHQTPLNAMSSGVNPISDPSGDRVLTDILGRETSINIFVGLLRDVESVWNRLSDNSANTTILAPLNTELVKMSRKPWEDPQDYNAFGVNAYEGAEGEARASRNLRLFVESHVIPQSPWSLDMQATTLAGTSVTLKEKDGKQAIVPDDIELVHVAGTVSNGQLWIIKGILRRGK